MTAPAPRRLLHAAGRVLELGERPWIMGVVNATPDSFSGAAADGTLEGRVALARSLLADGADLIDIGGESGVTNRPPVSVGEEITRVVPLVERVAGELGALVSVDTYTPAVAEAALAAGAVMVNDTSGLRDPGLADVCARTGAALVVMHTRVAPKEKGADPGRYADVAADVEGFLRERMGVALRHGVAGEQLLLDPGPDFAKTPAQSVAALRALGALHALGRPLLLAISRKDFIGALTGRGPGERLGGTLAAVDHGVAAGAHLLRVHDVAQVAGFLAVRAALAGAVAVPAELTLAEELRRQVPADAARPDASH